MTIESLIEIVKLLLPLFYNNGFHLNYLFVLYSISINNIKD